MSKSTTSWPRFSKKEAKAVKKVLRSNKINYQVEKNGEGHKFEREFADFAGTKHAIAVANGTVALDLALYGLGIGARNGGSADDEVIVTPRSFIASASCVVNAGAKPIFADVDQDSQNITPGTVEEHISNNTRAIILVHLAGWPCDMDGFNKLVEDEKRENGTDIKLIEDCAQAHGAKYKGRPVGGLGDVAAWSFCTDKIMTTGGEGGMVTVNDDDLRKRMWSFMNHGKELVPTMEYEENGKFKYVHVNFGTNWRLTEMQSAIGRIQLKRMPNWHRQRTENAKLIMSKLQEIDLFRVPEIPGDVEHAFYKLYVFVTGGAEVRKKVLEKFGELGIPEKTGAAPELYREPAFKALFKIEHPLENEHPRLPIAKKLGESSIMLLVHPGYDAQKIVDLLDKVNIKAE